IRRRLPSRDGPPELVGSFPVTIEHGRRRRVSQRREAVLHPSESICNGKHPAIVLGLGSLRRTGCLLTIHCKSLDEVLDQDRTVLSADSTHGCCATRTRRAENPAPSAGISWAKRRIRHQSSTFPVCRAGRVYATFPGMYGRWRRPDQEEGRSERLDQAASTVLLLRNGLRRLVEHCGAARPPSPRGHPYASSVDAPLPDSVRSGSRRTRGRGAASRIGGPRSTEIRSPFDSLVGSRTRLATTPVRHRASRG